ncbi:unnamed protein product [Prorocentrum cordatum]|uniref:Uncharacterized protein n=1 Tax=Prorocentrum cordatum TaxID=2364126 RepID=A0ABN9XM57_9DINO|nr:unnamed protein product [Polarella glacialis]
MSREAPAWGTPNRPATSPPPPPDPPPRRYRSWCGGRLGDAESLALAHEGQLLEVCELCHLLALARQRAWQARLTPRERSVLLEQARYLTAVLAALAGLFDAPQGLGKGKGKG